MSIQLQTGDIFCTRNPMALGRIIRRVESFWAKDNHAEYSHAGIMIDPVNSFEALWTNKTQDFFKAYKKEKVLIARYIGATEMPFDVAINKIRKEHEGEFYPLWRLPMMLFPPLAKINISDRPVCSELTAKYLKMIGARGDFWKGITPDDLADEWKNFKNYNIICEGKLNDIRC